MRLHANMSAMAGVRSVNSTTRAMGTVLDKLVSGLRITKARDDAAGLGVSVNLETSAISTRQAVRNTSDGVNILQTAEGAMMEVTNILQRMRELAVQSASETLANDERAYIEDEYSALLDEVLRVSRVTEYNGVQIADGSVTSVEVQVGISNSAESRIALDLFDLSSTNLGIASSSLASVAASRLALNTFTFAIDSVNQFRSQVGAVHNRLEAAFNNANISVESFTRASSRIQDADYAVESSRLTKLQIMQQAGVASLTQSGRLNEGAIALLS